MSVEQELIKRKWKKFLNEAEEAPSHDRMADIRIFVSKFVITVDKNFVDASDVANLIRSIPNVTTVAKDNIGQEQKDYYKALYRIKFVLQSYDDVNTYVNKVLKKDLQTVAGIRINSYRGTETIS
jgi:hypothetical protein